MHESQKFAKMLHMKNVKKEQKRAIVVDIISPETSKEEALARFEELENLMKTYGGIVVMQTIQKRSSPDYETYIGSGKVAEIAEMAEELNANLLIINNLLKPRQIFKLNEVFRKRKQEKEGGTGDDAMKVWDRVDLILKIFDKHAQTTEAKLQIELASIKHMGPRIFGMGIELSQQAGAMGVRAGAGETNVEMMKRHLQKQELNLRKKLEHYNQIREGHRLRRRKHNYKTAALVGYTNAGKSSLLNALTKKEAYVADQLFATLDTRVGKLFIRPKTDSVNFNPGREVLVSDTIGFIQDLPPELIDAFKSTLAETVDADLILHVIDVRDPQIEMKIRVVEDILKQLGAGDKDKIYVFNKIDLIDFQELITGTKHDPEVMMEHLKTEPGPLRASKFTSHLLGWTSEEAKKQETPHHPGVLAETYAKFHPVFVSAHEGYNLEKLIERIEEEI